MKVPQYGWSRQTGEGPQSTWLWDITLPDNEVLRLICCRFTILGIFPLSPKAIGEILPLLLGFPVAACRLLWLSCYSLASLASKLLLGLHVAPWPPSCSLASMLMLVPKIEYMIIISP